MSTLTANSRGIHYYLSPQSSPLKQCLTQRVFKNSGTAEMGRKHGRRGLRATPEYVASEDGQVLLSVRKNTVTYTGEQVSPVHFNS